MSPLVLGTHGAFITTFEASYISAFVQFRSEASKQTSYLPPVSRGFARDLQRDYSSEFRRMFIAVLDGKVVGQIVFRMSVRIQLASLGVLERYYGTGLGQDLLAIAEQAAIEHRKDVVVSVNRQNDRAKRFYEKAGFDYVGDYGLITANYSKAWNTMTPGR